MIRKENPLKTSARDSLKNIRRLSRQMAGGALDGMLFIGETVHRLVDASLVPGVTKLNDAYKNQSLSEYLKVENKVNKLLQNRFLYGVGVAVIGFCAELCSVVYELPDSAVWEIAMFYSLGYVGLDYVLSNRFQHGVRIQAAEEKARNKK